MKHMSVFRVNNNFTNIRSSQPAFWSSTEVKLFSTIGTPITAIIILLLIISLCCKCFQNKKDCVHKYTGPNHCPPKSIHINLEKMLPSLSDNPFHISPQLILEILKTCGTDLAKFECYICHKARCQTTRV